MWVVGILLNFTTILYNWLRSRKFVKNKNNCDFKTIKFKLKTKLDSRISCNKKWIISWTVRMTTFRTKWNTAWHLGFVKSQNNPKTFEWWWWVRWKYSCQLSYFQVSTHSSKKAHSETMVNQMNDFNTKLAPLWRSGLPGSMRALWTACWSLVSSSPTLLPWILCKNLWSV